MIPSESIPPLPIGQLIGVLVAMVVVGLGVLIFLAIKWR